MSKRNEKQRHLNPKKCPTDTQRSHNLLLLRAEQAVKESLEQTEHNYASATLAYVRCGELCGMPLPVDDGVEEEEEEMRSPDWAVAKGASVSAPGKWGRPRGGSSGFCRDSVQSV